MDLPRRFTRASTFSRILKDTSKAALELNPYRRDHRSKIGTNQLDLTSRPKSIFRSVNVWETGKLRRVILGDAKRENNEKEKKEGRATPRTWQKKIRARPNIATKGPKKKKAMIERALTSGMAQEGGATAREKREKKI